MMSDRLFKDGLMASSAVFYKRSFDPLKVLSAQSHPKAVDLIKVWQRFPETLNIIQRQKIPGFSIYQEVGLTSAMIVAKYGQTACHSLK